MAASATIASGGSESHSWVTTVTYSSALSYLADRDSSGPAPRICSECSCWLVMMFQAPRPLLTWSRLAISRARVTGSPYSAGAVSTRPMLLVWVASAASSRPGDSARNGRLNDSSARPA